MADGTIKVSRRDSTMASVSGGSSVSYTNKSKQSLADRHPLFKRFRDK
ncbi:hypothetical protein COOONC_15011 [Cooperia oncophora]